MAIFDDIKKIFGGGIKRKPERKPEKAPTPIKEAKKDTSIFGGKSAISMREAAWKIRKSSPYIPGSGGAIFSEKERMDIAKRLSKYGGYLEKGAEHSRIFKDLYKEKTKARIGAEKLKIDREIRYLKEKLGK